MGRGIFSGAGRIDLLRGKGCEYFSFFILLFLFCALSCLSSRGGYGCLNRREEVGLGVGRCILGTIGERLCSFQRNELVSVDSRQVTD